MPADVGGNDQSITTAPTDVESTSTPAQEAPPSTTQSSKPGILILVLVVGFIALSYVAPTLKACRSVLNDAGQPVELCNPFGMDDILPLGIVILLGLLALPGISEASIPVATKTSQGVTDARRSSAWVASSSRCASTP
jgi:hypothetical protein